MKRVSMSGQTFVSWLTEFSNDADLTIIQDSKYKKIEMFTDMQKTFSASTGAGEASSAGAGAGAAATGGAGATGNAQSSIKVHAPPGGKSSITF